MGGIILEASQIVKRFPGVLALDHVDFTLSRSELRALLGENGAGKSTLIKVITGAYRKDSGTVLLNGTEILKGDGASQDKIAFVPQELNVFKHLTVAENIFIPINREKDGRLGKYIIDYRRLNRKAASVLSQLDVDISPKAMVSTLGTAQLQMVQIARAIVQQFEILILDEPTSTISYHETENLFKILKALKAQGKSIIYITHKLDEIFQLADSVTILRDGRLVGTYCISEVDRNAIITKMAGEQLSELDLKKDGRLEQEKILFKVEGLSGACFKDISFELHAGEILGLAGLVGARRTEIAKCIFGALPKKTGRVFLDGVELRAQSPAESFRSGVIYMPEDRKQLGIFPMLSLRENISVPLLKQFSVFGMVSGRKEVAFVKDLVKKFNIRASSIHQEIAFLSGGNQQKAIIARSISANPRVLIFDEPTVGIDVKAKREIYSFLHNLAKTGLGIIIISSEIEELLKIADRIIVIHNGRIKGEFRGDTSCREEILCSALGL